LVVASGTARVLARWYRQRGNPPVVHVEAQGRELEHGVEKVAIYVDCDGVPTHAARQLADGTWTSKLGEWEDIQHDTLEAMEDREDLGLGYGKVGLLLRRQRR
jgi:hypothetical protein